VANPFPDETKREPDREVAPAPPGAGDDRPAHHKPEVLQEERHRHKQRPDEWVWCRRRCSCLSIQPVTRLYRRAFPVEPLNLFGRATRQVARHVASHGLTVAASLAVLVGDTDREREPEFPLAPVVHRVLRPVGRVGRKQFTKPFPAGDNRENGWCRTASASNDALGVEATICEEALNLEGERIDAVENALDRVDW